MSLSYLDTWMIVFIFCVSGFLGAAIGSFITCMADRIVVHENWVSGKSHCDACGHELGWKDLVPIFSFLLAGGKCRYCGTKLGNKYLITECLMAAAYIGALIHTWSIGLDLIMLWILSAVLLGLSVVDMQIYEIPDGYIIFGICTWLIGNVVKVVSGTGTWSDMVPGLIGGFAIAGGVLLLVIIMDKIMQKETMGGGDIKLMFMTGLYLGFACGLFALILSCIIGLFFVVGMKNDKIPFGPSISLAAYIALLIGPSLVGWYLSLF